MNRSKLLKVLNKGLITGLAVSAISFVIPLVPCTKSLVIENPKYGLGVCRLPNPFGQQLIGASQKFYGISTEPLAGFILQTLLILVIFSIFFSIKKEKRHKIIDLTKK